ncbi:MAG: ATP-binding cassette domain-containing protein [Bacilli bacterium]
MEILKCSNLNKSFGRKKILNNVSLSLEEGDILGFIGPNGAGKTTTIKLILGLQSIDSGTVTICGYDIKKEFTKAIKNVGGIIESPDMYLYLSGYDNLKLIANLYGVSKEKIDEVVKLVGLEKRIYDKVSKYSLGMRQRLGIAASLLNDPKLLILDEPTNGLDPEGNKQIRNLILKLSKKGIAILVSSHALSELESIVNKVVIIQKGSIVETSTLEEVKRSKNSYYIFEVDKIKDIDNIEKISENSFKVNINREEIPEFINKLIDKKIKIYSIYEDKLSLEDAFLKRTGGNKID